MENNDIVKRLKIIWNYFNEYDDAIHCEKKHIIIDIKFTFASDTKRACEVLEGCGFAPTVKDQKVSFKQSFSKEILAAAGITETRVH